MSAGGARSYYYYHLKLELYPTPPPAEITGAPPTKTRTHQKESWLPPRGTDIFSAFFPSRWECRSPYYQSKIDIGPACSAKLDDDERQKLQSAQKDWRYGPVRLESVDMNPTPLRQHLARSSSVARVNGPRRNGGSSTASTSARNAIHSTKVRIEPLGASAQSTKSTDLGWGIVHLYRESNETPGLAAGSAASLVAAGNVSSAGPSDAANTGTTVEEGGLQSEDTSILCIPAVPSYMLPSDFLGWVGEKTREQVSHFRMVLTEKMNRYLVLMKFRDGRVAKQWREDWDGKVFNGMEPENCHVIFIKSVVFDTPTVSSDRSISFPDMTHDPFTPAMSALEEPATNLVALRPFPPPTPSLVELPTCPVCLERMDDTTGLVTILCQHVFHCACLQKWRGSGCPVCRYTQPSSSIERPFGARPVGARSHDLCSICDCPDDLWICLVCGNVGCGRYKGGHAKEHFKETAHCYSLEIETQYVWDYAGDAWVHRLIQTKGDGKLVELPSSSLAPTAQGYGNSRERLGNGDSEMEMVPREKLENIGLEYTQMLTSQLESQRVYFEEVVKKAVDKASAASKSAETAAAKAEEAMAALETLRLEHKHLRDEVVPSLERDRDRMALKAEKSSELARAMTKSFQEEKQVGKGLMQRIEHINETMAGMSKDMEKLRIENEDLKEQNRDLGFFISSQEKLKELGGELGEEVVKGTVSLPERKEIRGRGKGKGKAK